MKPKSMIYLDYAAATPLDDRVLAAMQPYFSEQFANPSSLHASGRAAKAALEQARHRVAVSLGAKAGEIVFTAGATESVNLALLGLARRFPRSGVVTSAIEHDAVLGCLGQLKREGHPITLVPVEPTGLLDLARLEAALTDDTILISIAYANSEIGTIQPLRRLGQLIQTVRVDRLSRGVRQPIYLHSDASQAAELLDLHVSRLSLDLMTLSAAKVYGPKQVGVLYVRAGLELAPVIWGGGQERSLRSGTQNVANAVGLATALELAEADRDQQAKRLLELGQNFWSRLQAAIPGVTLNGSTSKRLAGSLSLTFPGVSGEELLYRLDAAGIAIATGAACSAGSGEPSHVLLALGLSLAEANSTVRLSFGRGTTAEQLDLVLTTLVSLVRTLRS